MQVIVNTIVSFLLNRLEKWAVKEYLAWKIRLKKDQARKKENKIALEKMDQAIKKKDRIHAARNILNGQ